MRVFDQIDAIQVLHQTVPIEMRYWVNRMEWLIAAIERGNLSDEDRGINLFTGDDD